MTLLFLNSIGTMEMVVIAFAIFMLFGSKGLPGFAKNIGKSMREIKTASNEIKRDIQNSALEMRKDLKTDGVLDELKQMGNVLEGNDTEPTREEIIKQHQEDQAKNIGPTGTKPQESSAKAQEETE